MTQERRQDEQLAVFTDALLEGQIELEESERPPLADAVETLAQTLSPASPPDHLRLKIRRRIAAEWELQHLPLDQQILKLFRQPTRRWAWAAAAALVVVAVAAALLLPTGPAQITGTATGEAGIVVLGVLLALAAVMLVVWLIRRR